MPGKKTAAKPAAKAKKPAPVPARKPAPAAASKPAAHAAHAVKKPVVPAVAAKPKVATTGAAAVKKPAAASVEAAPVASAAPKAGAAKGVAPSGKSPGAAPVATAVKAERPARAADTGPIATYVQRTPPIAFSAQADADDGDDSSLLAGPRNVSPYIAKRGEQYMNKEQLEHFRQILVSWKRDLMEEVDRTVSHMKDEAANFPDPNDRATQEEEFSLELRTRDRERKLIRKIEEALKRIEDGSYGYCLETGEEIGIKRLEARPVATLSIEAQERRERREKQYGDRDDRYR